MIIAPRILRALFFIATLSVLTGVRLPSAFAEDTLPTPPAGSSPETAPTGPTTEPVIPPVLPAAEPATLPLPIETPTEPEIVPTVEPVALPVTDPVPPIAEPADPTPTPEVPIETPVVEERVAPAEKETETYAADYELYKKYLLYQKYENRALYQKYQHYAKIAWRKGYFENRKTEKKYLKTLTKNYKKYIKKPRRYPQLTGVVQEFSSYQAEKSEYFRLKPFANYGYLERFNRDEYAGYEVYGGTEYRAGYERYLVLLKEGKVADQGDATLEADALGPEITVGIFNYVPKDLKDSAFKIKADKPFTLVHRDGTKVASIPAGKSIRAKYLGDKRFRVYDPDTDTTYTETSKEVRFEADDVSAIFDVSRPNSSFDRYRGDIKLRFYDSPETDGDRIWVINTLPLEHYVYGMGEITGTGPDEYDKVMTTIFRTYGYWKLKWSTKYADQGFKVDATSGNQIYYGYDWEATHGDIPKAADATRGTLVMYDREVALTPYSSWTDGKTRRFEDGHWGRVCKTEIRKKSELYPWLSAVSDEDGKHTTESTCTLASKGNHMVGLSANGAVRKAKNSGGVWDAILEHYYPGVDLIRAY